jgi:Ca-activated chloride channel family protein
MLAVADMMPARVFMLAAFALIAQRPAPDQSTFRAGVDVVSVDVSVLGRDRKPARDLAPGDFEVLEDGKPRPIVAFSSVEVPARPATAAAEAAWVREVGPDVAHNQGQDVRRVAIVLDDAMTPPEPRITEAAKAIARSIVDRLGPADQAAIVFTFYPGSAQTFTADRARLRAAIDRFQPRYVINRRPGMGADFDSAATYASARTLSNVADYMIGLPDRRKALAYISPGAGVDRGSLSPQGDDDLAITATQQLLTRARGANLTIYGFDPMGGEGAEAYIYERLLKIGLGVEDAFQLAKKRATLEREFLQSTSEQTGGRAIVNTSNVAPAVSAMFDELASYYLVGFQPAGATKDGKLRRLEVRVRRPDVIVQARNAYYATVSGAAPAGGESGTAAALNRAMHAAGMAGGVSLHAAAAPFAQAGKKNAKIAIVVGVDLPRAADGRGVVETADLIVQAFDAAGTVRATRTLSVDVTLRPARVDRSYYELLTDVDLAPGRYELRLGVRSKAQDRIGTVFQPIDVPEFSKAGLSLSGIVLSTIPALRAAPADAFAGLLPVVPTASRAFPRSIAVQAFARVYRGDSAPAGDVTVRTTVTSASGATVLDLPLLLAPAQFGSRRSADLSTEIPVKRLPAGDYLLTIQAQAARATGRSEIRFAVIE